MPEMAWPSHFSAHAYLVTFKILSLLRLQCQCWDSERSRGRGKCVTVYSGVGGEGGVS